MQPQAADVVIIGAGATRICRIGDHEQGRRGDSGPIPNRHRDRFFNGKLRVLQALTCGNECQSSSATGRLPFPTRLRKECRTKQYEQHEQQIASRRHMGLMCGCSHRTTPKPSYRNCKSLLCRRPSLHLRMTMPLRIRSCSARQAKARERGVKILEETDVTGIRLEGDLVVGVDTTSGPINARLVVNAWGPWADTGKPR
jgi:FAD dependent oxidoreductase